MGFLDFGSMNMQSKNVGYNKTTSSKGTPSQGKVLAKAGSEGSESSLRSGSVISGEVVETEGDSVRLKLSGDKYINARLDSGADIEKGQSMSFEVKSDSGQIELRPLYANLNATAATTAALAQAGLQATNANINMVNAMMEEGMPVNRDAIRQMARNVALNNTADPSVVVALSKLELPITKTNIEQFENYRNFEHQIINDAEKLTDGLSELISGENDEAIRDVLSLAAGENNDPIPPELLKGLETLSEKAGTPDTLEGEILDGETKLSADANISFEGKDVKVISEDQAEDVSRESGSLGDKTKAVIDGIKNAVAGLPEKLAGLSENEGAGQKISPEDIKAEYKEALKEVTDRLKEIGYKEEDAAALTKEGEGGEKLIKLADSLYSKLSSGEFRYDPLKEAFEKLFKTEGFKETLKDSLMKGFTLKPGDVADKEKVEEFYQKLNENSQKAAEILQNAGRSETQAFEGAKNIKDNLSFMDDINQMMQYVQLPLKMAGENAHGDLYVYTRNKHQIGKDGKLSALLHLDMETLGPMDVYVAMQSNRVNTHFYMQDEDVLDFMINNIDKLSERLKDKGYDMNTSVTTKDIKEDRGIVDAFLQTASSEGSINARVSKYSFDVRA